MPHIPEPEPRSLEDNRGDLESVAAMMERSWGASSTSSLLYTADFLRSCLTYPGADLSLAPTIYYGAEPVGFVAGLPRRIRYDGREFQVLLITFLTVADEHKNRGYGIVLWSELVRRARAAGYDGMVNYCVDGDPMNDMIVGAGHRIGLPVERVHSIVYLSKMLFPNRVADASEDVTLEAFLEAAAGITDRTPLARVWTDVEAKWQFNRPGAVLSRNAGGILTGYVQQVANRDRTGCLIVEDVLWDNLELHERAVLTAQLTSQAAKAGARLAIVPLLGYADATPFTENGFRSSGRVVHAYLTLWGDTTKLEPVSSIYLDVV